MVSHKGWCGWQSFRKIGFALFVLTLMFGVSARALAEEPFSYNNMTGVGLAVGTVNGISAYHRLSDSDFAQAMLGFGGPGNYYLAGDYCMAYPALFRWRPLVPYFCGGGFLTHFGRDWDYFGGHKKDREGKTYLGGRIPVGVQIFIPRTPLQTFAELAPSIFVIPETEVYLQANIGLRLVF